MKCDIILAGVGGQGILTIAYVLDNAAVNKGYSFKQAEVHGMSQRGGAVYSHLRIADHEVISDLIPLGRADLVVSVEPLEVQRYVRYLRGSGVIVSNIHPFKNIPDYPPDEAVLAALQSLPDCVLVDAKEVAEKARVPRAQNMAVLGAATPFLPFTVDDYRPAIVELFKAKGDALVESNMSVLAWGRKVGSLYKGLLDAHVPPPLVFKLMAKIDVSAIDPACTALLGEQLAADPCRTEAFIGGLSQRIPCNADLLARFRTA